MSEHLDASIDKEDTKETKYPLKLLNHRRTGKDKDTTQNQCSEDAPEKHLMLKFTFDIKSSEDIELWNSGSIPVALIHPASAGHGLNIQSGGHILIWFGLTWSLELYQQTNARLWRQGQQETVTIHHIVTKNTVDEDVLAALASKDVTQEKLIAAVKAQL